MEQKKASIIIPCWNAGNWIRESVASALSQTYRPLEVIVVDDGSIDGVTQQILRTLHDPRLRVFFRPHHGVAEARNFAIHQAAGDYILPLDADDGIEPGYLAACIDVLGTHPEVGMVYSRADCFGEDSGPWHLPDFTLGEMLVHNVIYNAGAFRKADFLRTTGYDQQLPCWEDWDFWLSLLALELRPWRLDEVYFHYRVHSGSRSWTQNTVPKLLQAQRYILQKHANLFQAHVAEYGMAFHQRLYTEKQKGIDDAGNMRLFRELSSAKAVCANPRRLSTVMMSVDAPVIAASAYTAFGDQLQFDWTVGANASDNPFRHAWHPDHDGKTADYSGPVVSGDDLANYMNPVKPELWSVTNTLCLSWHKLNNPTEDADFEHNPEDTTAGYATWTVGGLLSNGPIKSMGVFFLKRIADVGEIE